MRFFHTVSLIFAVALLGLLTFVNATPIVEEKRQLSSITEILDGLTSELGPILGGISKKSDPFY